MPGGETTSTITVNNPANGSEYFLTVSDESGCVDSTSTIITYGAVLPVDIFAPITEQCITDGPITLEVIPNGGTPPYNFEWTLPDGSVVINDSIIALQTGNYVAEIIDVEDCSGSDTVTITINQEPLVTLETVEGSLTFCDGESLTLFANTSAGEAPFNYIWNTPQGAMSGDTIQALTEGIYSVEVQDVNGCTSISSAIFVTESHLPNPDLGPDTIFVTDQVILDAGSGFVSYSWSTGHASQTIIVNATGDYIACVTDANGCTGCDTITVEIITNTIDLEDSGYLNIFPNPNSASFTISGELFNQEKFGITIVNTIGQSVYRSNAETIGTKISKEINLGNISPGVYYLQIIIGTERFIRKVVVE